MDMNGGGGGGGGRGIVQAHAPIQYTKALELQVKPCSERVCEDPECFPEAAEICFPPREEALRALRRRRPWSEF